MKLNFRFPKLNFRYAHLPFYTSAFFSTLALLLFFTTLIIGKPKIGRTPEVFVSAPGSPNCTNLTGPTTLTVGQTGTYKADFYSPQGQLRGRLGEGDFNIFKDQTSPNNNLNVSGTWTPTSPGTYLISCRAWNDGIAECRYANHAAGSTSACAGPNNYLNVIVTGVGNIDGFELGEPTLAGQAAPFIAEAKPAFIRTHLHWGRMVNSQGIPDWNSTEWTSLLTALTSIKNSYSQAKIILTIKSAPLVYRDQNWDPNSQDHECTRLTTSAGFNALRQFAKDVTSRLKPVYPQIKYLELWNEPDVEVGGSVSDYFGCWVKNNNNYEAGQYYANVLQAFYYGARDGGGLDIMAGALMCNNKANCADFLKGMKNRQALNYAKAVSFHHYQGYYNTTDPNGVYWVVNDTNNQNDIDDYYHLVVNTLGSGSYKVFIDETGLMCKPSTPCASAGAYRNAFLRQQGQYWGKIDAWAKLSEHSKLAGILNYTFEPSAGWMDTGMLGVGWQKKCIYYKFLNTNLGLAMPPSCN